MKFTVLGSKGFIGSNLIEYLSRSGIPYYAPERDDSSILEQDLGHVIYCIGLTADSIERPFDTVEAHVCLLVKVLNQCKFNSFLYLSSTRVYGVYKSGKHISREEDLITIQPLDMADLFSISKAMGESICLAAGRNNVRVVRPSNVYGYDPESKNFLPSLIIDALNNKRIVLHTSLDSSKDYVSVEDVVSVLPEIALHGSHRIYNLASGRNTTHGQITNALCRLTGCNVEVDENASRTCYPNICVDRIKQEFAFAPAMIMDDFEELVNEYKTLGIRENDKLSLEE
jgi:nucleoside-diphosphate-sugar epimerase